MARPRKYDESLRAALINDVVSAIAIGGPAAVSLRELAAGQGISTTAIYTLFGGKDELIAAAAGVVLERFAEAQEAVPLTDDPEASLIALGSAYREWAASNRPMYQFLFGGHGDQPNVVMAPTDPAVIRAGAPLRKMVIACQEAGVVEGATSEVLAMLMAGVHGFCSLEMTRWSEIPQDMRDGLFDSMLRAGVRAWYPDRADPDAGDG